jgi:hypothetical protein
MTHLLRKSRCRLQFALSRRPTIDRKDRIFQFEVVLVMYNWDVAFRSIVWLFFSLLLMERRRRVRDRRSGAGTLLDVLVRDSRYCSDFGGAS